MTSTTLISRVSLVIAFVIVLVASSPIDPLKPQPLTEQSQPELESQTPSQGPDAAVESGPEKLQVPNQSQPSTTKSPVEEAKKVEEPTELPEVTSNKDTSTFTCSGKVTGYYADVKLGCRVYHFCTQMDTISGAASYQRMSYMCLEDSYFDQKDLNCVKKDQLKVPCHRAEAEYESSNRQFDAKEEKGPSLRDNLAANIMMNPIARYIAGR